MWQTLLMALVAGCIIGPLARLALPGRQSMGLGTTIGLGALGALAGSAIYTFATGNADTPRIDWIAGLIGVVVAALLIVIYGNLRAKR